MVTECQWIDADVGNFLFKFKSKEIEQLTKTNNVSLEHTIGKIAYTGRHDSHILEVMHGIEILAADVRIMTKFFNTNEMDTLSEDSCFKELSNNEILFNLCKTAGDAHRMYFEYNGLHMHVVSTSAANFKDTHVLIPVDSKCKATGGTSEHILKSYGFSDQMVTKGQCAKSRKGISCKPEFPLFFTFALDSNGHGIVIDDWYTNKKLFECPRSFCGRLRIFLLAADDKRSGSIALPLEIGRKCPVTEIAKLYSKTVKSICVERGFRHVKNIYFCVLKVELLEPTHRVIAAIFDIENQLQVTTCPLLEKEPPLQITSGLLTGIELNIESGILEESIVLQMSVIKDNLPPQSPVRLRDKSERDIQRDVVQSLDNGYFELQLTNDGQCGYTVTCSTHSAPGQPYGKYENHFKILMKKFFKATRSYNVHTLKISSFETEEEVSCNNLAKDMFQSAILHGKKVGVKTVTFMVNERYDQLVNAFRDLHHSYKSQMKKIRRSHHKIIRNIVGKIRMSKVRIMTTMTEIPLSEIIICHGSPRPQTKDGDIFKGSSADVLVRQMHRSDTGLTRETIYILSEQSLSIIDGVTKEQYTTALEYAISERTVQMLSIVLIEGNFPNNIHAVTQIMELVKRKIHVKHEKAPEQINIVVNGTAMNDLVNNFQSFSSGGLYDLHIMDNSSQIQSGSVMTICASTDDKVEEAMSTIKNCLEPPAPPRRIASDLSAEGRLGKNEKKTLFDFQKRLSGACDTDKQTVSLSSFSDSAEISMSVIYDRQADEKGRNGYLLVDKELDESDDQDDEEENRNDYILVKDKIYFNIYKELGKGAFSTVFEGRYESQDGMTIAVKRINCNTKQVAKSSEKEFQRYCREVNILNKLEQGRNSNVVGYYLTERKKHFLFIAFELCQGTLADYVNPTTNAIRGTFPPNRVNKCMASGLNYLHSNHIVHRDLKPENILMKIRGNKIENIVLGDFGSSKCIIDKKFSFSSTTGTNGYVAQEVLKAIKQYESDLKKEFLTASSDIFSLGILFYFTLSNGCHPFGTHIEWQHNILEGHDPVLTMLTGDQFSSEYLIRAMFSHDNTQRPNAETILVHPGIWSPSESLENLQMWSDNFESVIRDSCQKIGHQHIEDPSKLPYGDWLSDLPSYLMDYLDRYKMKGCYIYRINRTSVRYLLRAIRNTEAHFNDLPNDVKNELGGNPHQRLKIWLKVSPELILHLINKLGPPEDLQFSVKQL